MSLLSPPSSGRRPTVVQTVYSGPASGFSTQSVTFDPQSAADAGVRRLTIVAHTNGTTLDSPVTMNMRYGDHESADFEQVSAFVQSLVVLDGNAFTVITPVADSTNGPKPQFTWITLPVLDVPPKLNLQFVSSASAGTIHIEIQKDA